MTRVLQRRKQIPEVMVDNQASTVAALDEARIVHKLKIRIIPFVFVLYVISFLDRMNISFAAGYEH